MVHSEAQTPIKFEPSWLSGIVINLSAINRQSDELSTHGNVTTPENRIQWAMKALRLTDLTTLAGDDTPSNVQRLCLQAVHPFSTELTRNFNENSHSLIHTAAVCVYPARVADAYGTLTKMNKSGVIPVAAVATGFPSGQYSLATRLAEIQFAIESGATEIDIVLNRTLVLQNDWESLYNEVVAMRKQCGISVHMKTILAIGECGTMENVYKASMVSMMAGSDFIKTSTGKESVNATLAVGLVMIRAIKDFGARTGRQIGLKPAGGVRTVDDAINWMRLIKNTLGDEWLTPNLFRFGASGLVNDIEQVVEEYFRQQQQKIVATEKDEK